MTHRNFAAFIVTHGRVNAMHTYHLLKRSGYTGRIIVLIDDQDATAPEYFQKFGDEVVQFDKLKAWAETDSMDNFPDLKTGLYAWNAAFGIAKEQGLETFLLLDDDYTSFHFRIGPNAVYKTRNMQSLDAVFDAYLDFLNEIPALSIAMAQGGDFIGGSGSGSKMRPSRKVMNSFFCRTDRPFKFLGKLNGDVTTYTTLGQRGELFLTIKWAALIQKATQTGAGGMSDIYLDNGTYVKSFY